MSLPVDPCNVCLILTYLLTYERLSGTVRPNVVKSVTLAQSPIWLRCSIRYFLPVLWMTSCLYIMDPMAAHVATA